MQNFWDDLNGDCGPFGRKKQQKIKKFPEVPEVKKLKKFLEPCKPNNSTKARRAAIRKYLKKCEFWLEHTEKVVKYTDSNQKYQSYMCYSAQYAFRVVEEENKSEEQIRQELRRLHDPVPTVEDLKVLVQQPDTEVSDRAKMLLQHWGYREDGIRGTDPPIVRYARSGMLKMVKLLVQEGFQIDECLQWKQISTTFGQKSQNLNGDSALSAAAREGHEDVVQYLLKNGANPEHKCCLREDVYETPSEAARKKGHEKIARLIEEFKEQEDLPEHRESECENQIEVEAVQLQEEIPGGDFVGVIGMRTRAKSKKLIGNNKGKRKRLMQTSGTRNFGTSYQNQNQQVTYYYQG